MICTVEEAKKKLCVPLSCAMSMEWHCDGDMCMAWCWVDAALKEEAIIYSCKECGHIATEPGICHSKQLTLVDPDVSLPGKGFCRKMYKGD